MQLSRGVAATAMFLGLTLTAGCGTASVGSPEPTPSSPTVATGTQAATQSESTTKRRSATAREKQRRPSGHRTVYLTFDDGPSSYTGAILDILQRHDALATFFVIGQNVGGRAKLVRRAKRAGMSVQNHTWDHADLRNLSSARIRSQIRRTDQAIKNAGGGRSSCVRPPYGATNARVRSVLAGMGKRQRLWDVDTVDWQRPGASKIYRRVVNGVRSGSVVLSHDGGGNRSQTVAALPRILRTLKARGYTFGALCR